MACDARHRRTPTAHVGRRELMLTRSRCSGLKPACTTCRRHTTPGAAFARRATRREVRRQRRTVHTPGRQVTRYRRRNEQRRCRRAESNGIQRPNPEEKTPHGGRRRNGGRQTKEKAGRNRSQPLRQH